MSTHAIHETSSHLASHNFKLVMLLEHHSPLHNGLLCAQLKILSNLFQFSNQQAIYSFLTTMVPINSQ